MHEEIKTTMDINNIEFDVSVEFIYTPRSVGSDVEPSTEEEVEVFRLCILSENEDGNESSTDISLLLDDETFNESVVELVYSERF